MTEPKRRPSWGLIIGIGALAALASITASYLVQRFALGKPHPDIKVSVVVATLIPIMMVLVWRRKA
jgi:hypothetical protein